MVFQRRGHCSPARHSRSAPVLGAAALTLAMLASGCSEPPPPAPEPTGQQMERAWRVAVGSDRLDRTVAEIYAQALNSHEAPTVVVRQEDTAAELAAALARGERPANAETDGDDADDRYELVVSRTVGLAEELDPEGYAELTVPEGETGVGPAAEPEELTELIEAQLEQAELFDPTAAVLRSSLHLTSVTAERAGIEDDDEEDLSALSDECADLVVGVSSAVPGAGSALEETYDCTPEELRSENESTLVELLITAEIDAAVFSASHPSALEHALVSLPDARSAFPQEQYAPVVSLRIADDVPGVVEEVSQALDDEALVTLRRLIDGDDGLQPEDAATYWLVEEGLLAEPDNWG
ncbi:glycine betaine ABC transporter substrate-binding protein [Nesterenkonia sphaerica]|nr:glycine betaine ABC transporter substrate-binding protein [Nesterenkonia sphaerica]